MFKGIRSVTWSQLLTPREHKGHGYIKVWGQPSDIPNSLPVFYKEQLSLDSSNLFMFSTFPTVEDKEFHVLAPLHETGLHPKAQDGSRD